MAKTMVLTTSFCSPQALKVVKAFSREPSLRCHGGGEVQKGAKIRALIIASPSGLSSTCKSSARCLKAAAAGALAEDGGGDGGGGVGGLRGGGGNGRGGGGGSGEESFGGHSYSGGALSTLFARYMDLLDRYPLIVKSLTAGVLNTIADFICQVFFEKTSSLDLRRMFSSTSVGLFMSGPGLHFWYGILGQIITAPGIGGSVLRTALDQFIFTPFGLASYFIAICTLEGRQHEIEAKLTKDWLPTVIANWKVWIPFQIINFRFVPPQLQVAATSLLGVVWCIFMSFAGHS